VSISGERSLVANDRGQIQELISHILTVYLMKFLNDGVKGRDVFDFTGVEEAFVEGDLSDLFTVFLVLEGKANEAFFEVINVCMVLTLGGNVLIIIDVANVF